MIGDELIKLHHMEVLFDDSEKEDITYLYKLKNGKSSSSFGIRCAAMCGIDKQITDKAQLLYEEIVRGEDISRHFMTFTADETVRLKKAVSS